MLSAYVYQVLLHIYRLLFCFVSLTRRGLGVLDAIYIRYAGSEWWVSIASHTLSHELARFISVNCVGSIRKVHNLDSILYGIL
jgi:hypothetical protein